MSQLYTEVHIIAYFYHWTEKEILRLSSRKRKMYAEMISEQVKHENGSGDEYD